MPAAHSPRTAQLIRVFVSSPRDVGEYRKVLDEIVASINRVDGARRGFRLELWRWEVDVVPRIAREPQPVVDEQTPPYDVYLGIMSTRFGTATSEHDSGTEAEFRAAWKAWQTCGKPWLAFYFEDRPRVGYQDDEVEQYRKVSRFRAELDRSGIVGTFEGLRGASGCFYEKVSEHLRAIAYELAPPVEALPQNSTTGRASVAIDGIDYYVRRLAKETESLTLLGMGRSLQIDLPIAEAFVPLRTTLARSFELDPKDRLERRHLEQPRDIDLGAVFLEAGRLKLRGVVLLGEPGSGKTTGARQLAWRLASGQCAASELGLPELVTPVLLRFRNLGRQTLSATTPMEGLRQFLLDETHCPGAPSGQRQPGDALLEGAGGPLLWILDGLDEVVDPHARRTVSEWLRDAVRQRLDDRFLVTCRFQGYFRDGVPLGAEFAEFHVQGLNQPQIERFVRDWFGAAYRRLKFDDDAAVVAKAETTSTQLLDILARPEHQLGHVRELCTNPLLLTILCIVFHEERKLPTGRAELYAHCVRVLLQHWRQDLYKSELGSTLQAYDPDAARAVLARLAWFLHQEEQRTTAPLAELSREAGVGLAQVSANSGLGRDGGAFIERMRSEAGILALGGEGTGQCGFLHLSFQEYLAAEHAAREGLAEQLASRATDSWWREVALLSLRHSRPFCESFFREAIALGIVEDQPDLAERFLQESLFFASQPFLDELDRSEWIRSRASPWRKFLAFFSGRSAGKCSDRRTAALLRLLRERIDETPGLADRCRDLALSPNREVRDYAIEILARLGLSPPSRSPQPFEVSVDERTGLTFVLLPPGEFRMGGERNEWEGPMHRVRLTQGFQLSKYPVTNAQYAVYLKSVKGEVAEPEYWGDRRFNQPEQPVVGVSWDDAMAYCDWAGCRLPTEAEWEYACRAGTSTEYCFGDDDDLLGDYAWYAKNSGGQPHPVGAKLANDWGLHDMHGNVWEWCADRYQDDYGAEASVVDPKGPKKGVGRAFRGGSWDYSAECCRSAYRGRSVPGWRDGNVGFRVARSPSSGESVSTGAK